MVVIFKRAAASLVVGASLLSGAAHAQLPCWDAATTPVRRLFQDNRYGAGEMQRAAEEIRLNQRRVELERRTQALAQEYATYNADVTAYLHYNFARQPNTSLYLPLPAGLADPNATGAFAPSEPWPNTGAASVQQNPAPVQHHAPASQPGYNNPPITPLPQASYPAVQQQVYPPVPTQVLPQPNGVYNPLPREQSLMWNGYEYPGYIPAYTAQQPGPYRY